VTLAEVQTAMREAIHDLIRFDANLFTLHVGERAIVAALCQHVRPRFPDWSVDAEYNRHGRHPKYLTRYYALLRSAELQVADRPGPVAPDLVIHHRGTDEMNLVAAEVKRSSNKEDRRYDLLRLQALREQLGYRYTVFLEFEDTNRSPVQFEEHWSAT
jgi:hypothetical protein